MNKTAIDDKPKYPELFIGLVSAVGTPHERISGAIEARLQTYDYEGRVVRVAKSLSMFEKFARLPQSPLDEYIAAHQRAGDDFREALGREEAMALLSVLKIRAERRQLTNDEKLVANHGVAYIIRSFKRPEEVDAFREIYGTAFVLLGMYSPHERRVAHLSESIASSRHEAQPGKFRSTAETLMQTDENEGEKKFGQRLRETFEMADIFIDVSEPAKLTEQAARTFDILFGNTFLTPNRDEYGMFHARAAALRSAELGRQVGAAITTDRGDVLALGTNEVPRAGGGLYWCDDRPDHREWTSGEDANDKYKRQILADLLERLKQANWLSESNGAMDVNQLVDLALDKERSPHIAAMRLTSVIEFGRAVHAEMAAITDAARLGVPITGTTMYLTTFPCHLCAKHIVAAGIKRVVYIEPYIKSLTLQLYPEAFSFENENNAEGRVHLLPFVGVAPRAYLSLFPALDRKDDRGKVIPFSPADAVPRLKGHPQTYIRNETRALELLENAVKKASLTTTGTTDVTSENASGPQKYLTSDGSESHGRDRGTEITPEERGGRG